MAIDSAEKRKAVVGCSGPPCSVGITNNATHDAEWRQESGWGYPGIAAAAPAPITNLNHAKVGTMPIFVDDAGHTYVGKWADGIPATFNRPRNTALNLPVGGHRAGKRGRVRAHILRSGNPFHWRTSVPIVGCFPSHSTSRESHFGCPTRGER